MKENFEKDITDL